MKNNISILVAIIALILTACTKDETNLQDGKQTKAGADFSQHLKERIEAYKTNRSMNGFVLACEENPFDIQGYMHNEVLKKFDWTGTPEMWNTENIMNNVSGNFGVEFLCTPEWLEAEVVNISSIALDNDGNYSPEYIDGIDIPLEEKEIINEYFSEILLIEDIYERVAISKDMEIYVVEMDLSDESKVNLLQTMAGYRYSSFFWATGGEVYFGDQWGEPSGMTPLVDALAFYAACHSDVIFEDPVQIYSLAGSMSLVYHIMSGISF